MTRDGPSDQGTVAAWIIREGLWFGRWFYLIIAGFLLFSGGVLTGFALRDGAYPSVFMNALLDMALVSILPILTSIAVWRMHPICVVLAMAASAVLLWFMLHDGGDVLDPTSSMTDKALSVAMVVILALTPLALLLAWSHGEFEK